MNKISGKLSDFSLITEDASRIIIGYGLTQIGESDMYEWYEVYLYKSKLQQLNIKVVRDAVNNDINSQTDEKILSTFPWTVRHGDDEGKEVKVWLSRENQDNFKAKHDAAIMYPELVKFPMTYKISEDEDENAVFEVFQNIEELAQFYLSGSNYIQQCYEAGWDRKKAIDWSEYEEALNNLHSDEPNTEES